MYRFVCHLILVAAILVLSAGWSFPDGVKTASHAFSFAATEAETKPVAGDKVAAVAWKSDTPVVSAASAAGAHGTAPILGSQTLTFTVRLPLVMTRPFVATGMLGNGGVVTGPDGVKMGAVADALPAPLPVAIVPANPPAEPLPSPSTRLGNYYRISAQRKAVQPLAKSFILALPVPQGADTTRLAVAVHTSNANLLDAANPSGYHWELVPGVYDAANRLLLMQLPYLAPEGETVTLVQHPDMVTLRKGAGGRLARSNIQAVGQFIAACHNLACELAIKSQVENELEINRIEFGAYFSYPFPRLQGSNSDMSVDPPLINQPSDYYFVFIAPTTESFCTGKAGLYNPARGSLWLCRDSGLGGLSDFEKKVLRHEYFHALEYAHDPVLADWETGEQENWIIEGMADAVVNSDVDWHRSGMGNPIRPIDRSLRDDTDLLEYQAEDFWVYLGRAGWLGGGVEKLKDILVLGADLDAVRDFALEDFHDAYWDWVRNQAFEKRDDMDGALGGACQLEDAAVPNLIKASIADSFDPLVIGSTSALNAIMVEVVIPPGTLSEGLLFAVHVSELTGAELPPGFNYKIYKMPADAPGACALADDNQPRLFNYEANTRYFVLLANATEAIVNWRIDFMLF